MDPRTGQLGQNHEMHQQVIEQLINAGLLSLREGAGEDESQFIATGRRKRAGASLPKKLELSIAWGYEVHSVKLTPRQWADVVGGEEVTTTSWGWYEGKRFRVFWSFNCGSLQDLYVTYGNDSGVGYEGNVFDLYIREAD